MTESGKCPVCRAKFRGAVECSRCGADLRPLMRLALEAWKLRSEARRALAAGDLGLALDFAAEAERTQSTPSGAMLVALCNWLDQPAPSASLGTCGELP